MEWSIEVCVPKYEGLCAATSDEMGTDPDQISFSTFLCKSLEKNHLNFQISRQKFSSGLAVCHRHAT